VKVLEEIRSLRHAPTCATGSRAETRGPCDCGAEDRPAAWAIQIVDEYEDNDSRPMVRIVADVLTREELFLLRNAIPVASERCHAISVRRERRQTKQTQQPTTTRKD
jgi:hypothetical protein